MHPRAIDPNEARRLFAYDPATGAITRRITQGGQRAGTVVGTFRVDGYLATTIGGREVLCHRLAWALHYGADPCDEIDHRNGVRSENRIKNLRQADRGINNQNRRNPHRNNQLGVLGVRQVPSGRYIARIRVNKQLRTLGTFDTPEAASAVYLAAKRQLHEGNTL